MKIIDTFTFFNELDLLEIRLNELYDVVDEFILVESTQTHSGLNKPLYFATNFKRFEKFSKKISYHVMVMTSTNPWKNEYDQRNAIAEKFQKLKDNDIIILSDLDEIPNRETLKNLKVEDGKIYNCVQKLFFYYLNVQCTNINWIGGSQAFSYRTFKESGNSLTDFRRSNNLGFQSKPCNIPKVNVENGGWHFSYLGGIDKVKEKMISFMHQEMVKNVNLDSIEDLINNLNWIYKEHKVDLKQVEFDETYPKYLLGNLDKFKHLVKE